ncbi:hypothetical protein [Nisaea nitritireducens]|uniref:hypothetical protein n=1 Tax=Nisaea nitritireducens TaxID=568392 RepID=UPI0018667A74|nr:hypothetical protein [Nisaea nitritireducens]
MKRLAKMPVLCLVVGLLAACASVPAPLDLAADQMIAAKSNKARAVRLVGAAELTCATLKKEGAAGAVAACQRLRDASDSVAAAVIDGYFETSVSAAAVALLDEVYRFTEDNVPPGDLSTLAKIRTAFDALKTVEGARAGLTDLADLVAAVDADVTAYDSALAMTLARFDNTMKN